MNKPKLNQPINYLQELKRDVSTKGNLTPFQKRCFEKLEETLNQPNPTIEEIKKEWEDDGYKFEVFSHKIEISKQITKDEINDTFTLFTKRIIVFTRAEQYTANYLITLKEHIRLTKTFKALGWEV